MGVRVGGLLVLLVGVLAGCDSGVPAITGCDAVGDASPVCQFKNPEDIEGLPDGKTLLISQMGDLWGTVGGRLTFYDTETGVASEAFPADDGVADWGEMGCEVVPGGLFAPHGVSLKRRDDGQLQLAVINHGGRESVEMFSVQQEGGRWGLTWRGCVLPEDGTFMNDLALMRDGGFVASHMFDKRDPVFGGVSVGMLKAQLGVETGYVFEWRPVGGYRILDESRGPFLNGVEISSDNNTVYASVSSGREIRKLDRKTGKMLLAANVVHADNMTWDAEGWLLAVAAGGSISEQMDCLKIPGQTCAYEFFVHRINPDDMSSEVVFKHQGAPMGAGTVARQVGDRLYVGSFSGDRIINVPYNQAIKK